MNNNLSMLAAAIADAGHWHWWSAQPPKFFHAEFVMVRLYLPPRDPAKPPCNQFALSFGQVHTVQFLEFAEGVEPGWQQRIEQDELQGGQFVPNGFALGNLDSTADIVSRALRNHDWFSRPESETGGDNLIACAFQTGTGLGALVVAERLKLISEPGEIPLETVPQMQKDWWSYWKRYWKLVRTPQALPRDINCDISFPGGPLDEE